MVEIAIGGYLSVRFNCYNATGATANADSTPTWRIVAANSDTTIISGNCTSRSTGAYEVYTQIDASHFTAGGVYHLLVTATVGGVTDADVLVTAFKATTGDTFAKLDAIQSEIEELPRNVGGAIVTVTGGAAESELVLVQRRGDDATFSFTCLDSAGQPIDLTDANVTFTVKPQTAREDPDDSHAVIQKTANVIAPSEGRCEVTVSGADTEVCELYVEYDFDLQADAGVGKVRTLVVGTYQVLPDVTRASSDHIVSSSIPLTTEY